MTLLVVERFRRTIQCSSLSGKYLIGMTNTTAQEQTPCKVSYTDVKIIVNNELI